MKTDGRSGTMEKVYHEYTTLFQAGNEKGLTFFYLEFHAALALYANRWVENRSIAEEIASEAFVKIWKMHEKLDSYGAIRAYLYKIVYRDAMHTLRKEQKRNKVEQIAKLPEVNNDTPYHHVVRTETYRMIRSALKELAPGSQRVLTMYYLEGKSSVEIAAELNLSPGTIRNQKRQGLAALRKKFQQLLLLFSAV